MILNDDEFGYVHVNVGDKKISDEELEEIKDYLREKKVERSNKHKGEI